MPVSPETLRVLASPAFKGFKNNPYTWALNTELSRLGVTVEEFHPRRLRQSPKPHIWHLHWPEGCLKFRNPLKVMFKIWRLHACLRLAKENNVKIVWTIHNLGPHERQHPRLEKYYWRIFLANIDACMHLSEQGRALAHAKFGELKTIPGFVMPLIHYREAYADYCSRAQAREQLAIPENSRVLLVFGQIRRYKKIPDLIATFKQLPGQHLRLIIAGWPREKDLHRQIEQACEEDARIVPRLEFIADEQVQQYMRAADLTVAPYRDILNSGTALLSLSFDCPVLAPNLGALRELQQAVGPCWLSLYDGELTPEILNRTLSSLPPEDCTRPNLSAFESDQVAQKTLAAFKAIASFSPNSDPG